MPEGERVSPSTRLVAPQRKYRIKQSTLQFLSQFDDFKSCLIKKECFTNFHAENVPPKIVLKFRQFLTCSICRLVIQDSQILWQFPGLHSDLQEKPLEILHVTQKELVRLENVVQSGGNLGQKTNCNRRISRQKNSETEPPRKFKRASKKYVLSGKSTKSNARPAEFFCY